MLYHSCIINIFLFSSIYRLCFTQGMRRNPTKLISLAPFEHSTSEHSTNFLFHGDVAKTSAFTILQLQHILRRRIMCIPISSCHSENLIVTTFLCLPRGRQKRLIPRSRNLGVARHGFRQIC